MAPQKPTLAIKLSPRPQEPSKDPPPKGISPPTNGLVVSKEWKLPPRLKPGRKPSATSARARKAAAAANNMMNSPKIIADTNQSDTIKMLREELKRANDENRQLREMIDRLRNEMHRSKHPHQQHQRHQQHQQHQQHQRHHRHQQHQQHQNQHQHQQNRAISSQSPSRSDSQNQDENSLYNYPLMQEYNHDGQFSQGCGLCEHGESCMCGELGLRDNQSNSVVYDEQKNKAIQDLQKEYENFVPIKAIPLTRRREGEPTSSIKKFKRQDGNVTSTFEFGHYDYHQHRYRQGETSSGIIQPNGPYQESERCGFCPSDLPCICGKDGEASSPIFQAGSCVQCQNDPMGTLFCTTLFASAQPLAPHNIGMTISCFEAYQTISRHQNFGMTDLGLIVSHLETDGDRVSVQSITKALMIMN